MLHVHWIGRWAQLSNTHPKAQCKSESSRLMAADRVKVALHDHAHKLEHVALLRLLPVHARCALPVAPLGACAQTTLVSGSAAAILEAHLTSSGLDLNMEGNCKPIRGTNKRDLSRVDSEAAALHIVNMAGAFAGIPPRRCAASSTQTTSEQLRRRLPRAHHAPGSGAAAVSAATALAKLSERNAPRSSTTRNRPSAPAGKAKCCSGVGRNSVYTTWQGDLRARGRVALSLLCRAAAAAATR